MMNIAFINPPEVFQVRQAACFDVEDQSVAAEFHINITQLLDQANPKWKKYES